MVFRRRVNILWRTRREARSLPTLTTDLWITLFLVRSDKPVLPGFEVWPLIIMSLFPEIPVPGRSQNAQVPYLHLFSV
jgi:hypothetical protein